VTDRRFEVTFTLDIPREEAWRTSPVTARRRAIRAHAVWMPGFEARATRSRSTGRLLRVTKADEPCKDTEIIVVLEDEARGHA